MECRRLRVSDPRSYRHHLCRTIRRSLLHLSGAAPGPKVGSRMVQGRGRLAEREVNEFLNNLVTISIEESGFGITKNELVNNFGTITKAFEAMSAGGVISGLTSLRPIGFGQGFCCQEEQLLRTVHLGVGGWCLLHEDYFRLEG